MLPRGVRALSVQHRFHYLFGRMLLNLFLFVRLSLVFRLVGELGRDLGLEDGLGLGRLGLVASRSRELRVDKVIKEKFLEIVAVSLLDLVESLG